MNTLKSDTKLQKPRVLAAEHLTRAGCLIVMTMSLAAGPVQAGKISVGGISVGVDVGGSKGNGLGVGVDVGIGGSGGIDADVDVGIGGGGVDVGADVSIGGGSGGGNGGGGNGGGGNGGGGNGGGGNGGGGNGSGGNGGGDTGGGGTGGGTDVADDDDAGVTTPTAKKPARMMAGLRCAKDGNTAVYNGFDVRDRSGQVVGMVHDAVISPDLKITGMRFQSASNSCYSLVGGTYKVNGNDIWINIDGAQFR